MAADGAFEPLPFDVDLAPELEAAMAEQRAEVEAIADGPWPPAFEDTIAALERSGQRLHVAERVFGDASSARATAETRALEAEMLPRLAAHHDAIGLDPRVFARIADLVARRATLGLDAEQDAVLDRYHRDLVRAGATLDTDRQARLRAINERLSTLEATYRANLREDSAALAVRVGDAAELEGLPGPLVEAAARAAREDGVDGHVLRLGLSSAQPVLEHLHDRALRERVHQASVARGLRVRRRGRRGADLGQHVHDGRDRAGRLRLELELGVGGEAEEPGPLGAQRRDLADDGAVVVRPAAPAARHRRVVHPLPQRAIVQVLEHRLRR